MHISLHHDKSPDSKARGEVPVVQTSTEPMPARIAIQANISVLIAEILMQRRLTTLLVRTALCASTLLAFDYAGAQTATSLIGTWRLISLTVLKSGTPVEILGEHPEGQLVLGDDGCYTLIAVRANLPKLASADRTSASADESAQIFKGSVAHFGTYVADPATHTIEFHIRKGTFPNWDGETQVRPFVLEGDRLTYITPGSYGYGASTAVWRRDWIR